MKRAMATIIAVFFVLGGCETTEDDYELAGSLLGGAAGAVIGYDLGDTFGALIGASAGLIVGGLIGEQLDDKDRIKAQAAVHQAVQQTEPTRVTWTSDENPSVHGYVQTISADDSPKEMQCKTARHVYYNSGKEFTDTQRYCLENGRWLPG